MGNESKAKERKVVCPNCGKAINLRIVELHGTLRYSLLCKGCKTTSIIEVQDIESPGVTT